MSVRNHILLLSIFLLGSVVSTLAQTSGNLRITGAGVIQDPGDKTKSQLYELARQEAIRNALYENFGSIVFSSYERLMETEMSGKSVVSHSDRRVHYAKDFPNGIWIRDIEEETHYKEYTENGKFWIKCTITGIAREMDIPPVQFEATTLDGTDTKKNRTGNFVSTQQGYIHFKTAADGYLMIFLDDFNKVYRCLPYNGMHENYYPVKAHTDYIFFAPELAEEHVLKQVVDELEFYTEKGLEYNQFYIFFSEKPFSPPILDQELELGNGYSTFKSVDPGRFQTWLQKQRIKNEDLQLQTLGITIQDF